MIDIRIIKGALVQNPIVLMLTLLFIVANVLKGTWHLGIASMAYAGPLVFVAMLFGGSWNGLRVIKCLPVERSRLANSVWVAHVFVLPALVSGMALFFTALLLIRFHGAPGTVLSRWLFFSVLNVVLSGSGFAYAALYTRAKAMRYAKARGPYVVNVVGAALAVLVAFIPFARAPFSFHDLGEVRALACAGACAYMVLSFFVREYLLVDTRTLSDARKPSGDGVGRGLWGFRGTSSRVGNLMVIGFAAFFGSVAFVRYFPSLAPLLLGELYRPEDANFAVWFFLLFACFGLAWVLMIRGRMMTRTFRMLPLTSTGIVALLTARYCALALGVTVALATLQGTGMCDVGISAFVGMLDFLGVILFFGALALFFEHPQYVAAGVLGCLVVALAMDLFAGLLHLHLSLRALEGGLLVLAGFALHYYAITRTQVVYRRLVIGGGRSLQ